MITQYQPCGDRMVLVEFANEISPETHSRVSRLVTALDKSPIPGVVEWIPSYRSVGIVYDPLKIRYASVVEELRRLQPTGPAVLAWPDRRIEIPVTYGGSFGPDLEFVAESHALTVDQAIALHTGAVYRVYLIGFTPGFPYLGGLPENLSTPRLAKPRSRVLAGSVAIGGRQTGVYPVDSPGGWRIIGRTPMRLFDPARPDPCALQVGDEVIFRSISHAEYGEWVSQTRRQEGEV